MDIRQAIIERHSVRQYKDLPIEEGKCIKLNSLVEECNRESGLNIQLVLNDPKCFDVFMAHYGMKFRNAMNYVALVGRKDIPDLEEKAGYYGEKIVLFAQQMGLNSCWVAGTFGRKKSRVQIAGDEKFICVIAIGYGENSGKQHRSKPVEKLCGEDLSKMPEWFREGVDAALLAPTAINQQKFFITMENDEPLIIARNAAMAKIDLGIVKYNFEAASGHKVK